MQTQKLYAVFVAMCILGACTANPPKSTKSQVNTKNTSAQASQTSKSTPKDVFIRKPDVVVRAKPTTESAKITVVQQGQPAKLVKVEGGWAKLNFANGTQGYVRRDLLSDKKPAITPQVSQQRTETVYVKSDNVSVRQGPSTSSNRITLVSKGASATILERKGEWAKLKFPAGTVGYVRRDLLTNTKPATSGSNVNNAVYIKGDNVIVRQGPSTSKPRITMVQRGVSATVLSREGEWAKLRFSGGTEGYVRRDLLTNTLSSAARTKTYIVKARDNDHKIAQKLGVSLTALHRANPNVAWTRLQIGQTLTVPLNDGGRPLYAPTGEKINYIDTRVAKVNSDAVNVRSKPNTNGSRIATVSMGSVATILSRDGAWYKVKISNGKTGYIRGDFLNAYAPRTSGGRAATPASNYVASKNVPHDPTSSNVLISRAKELIGTRYVYGGMTTRGFDCSGFVSYVYKTQRGITLPRRSRDQATAGVAISKSDLKPGDLVFFRTGRSSVVNHSGIYIGDGKFIHSSSAKGRVRIDSLRTGYYNDRYVTARRVSKGNSSASAPAAKPSVPQTKPAETQSTPAEKPAEVKTETDVAPPAKEGDGANQKSGDDGNVG